MKSLLKFALAAALALAPLPALALGAQSSTATNMSTQTADAVAITGGTVAGVTLTATGAALTTPTITGGTINGATINSPISTTIKVASAAVTANNTSTYANVTGLSQVVVPGTYKFTLMLPSTVASGTGGIKYAFNYTTTVLSSIEATSQGYTASAVAVQHTTTTTTQTDLFTQAAIVIFVQIEGTMVVTTGGTVDVQVAQNTANASNSIALIGGSFQLVRTS